ncbi:protein OBERON 4-like [Phragmites australis]|uniref:protein OBERON 4-like n=1 Tax=Phragmites australis TaxID=29695 RepID=UPI002D792BA8|nr:protein OBERON 4-like [Phragmites australis]
MKRQRSYGDGLDENRRRFYDRGPPPPPPPRRHRREYEGDRFDRRKGFGGGGGGGGGGGSYDNRYREYPSPREYGGDQAMHRSESFSGFRREFPKGFRSERDRPRRDDDGSSAWRRLGGGWRDAEGLDEYRAPTRLSAASLPAPLRRSRSPSEPRRRLEVAKAERLRKQSAGISEIEEGEVSPDAEPKARPAAVEHRKQVEPSRAKEKRPERGKVKKVDSGAPADLGTHGKGVTGASDPHNAGKEKGKRSDGMVAEAGEAMDKGRGKFALKVAEEVGEGQEVQAQDVAASDPSKFGLSTKPMQHEVKPQEETTNSVDVVGQSTSSSLLEEAIQEEATTRDGTTGDIDEVGKSASSSLRQGVQEEVMVLHKTGSAADEIGKSTSPIMQQEVLQEGVLASDGTAYAVDEVGKSCLSGMLQEIIQEEVMQRNGTANAVDRVEIGTSSSLLWEAMHEKMTILDEITNTVDAPQQVSCSGMLKEAMHEGELMLDGTANTTGVVRQSTTSDMAEEVLHGKAAAQEGTINAVDVESNVSTGLQGEVMACLYQQAPENKEFKKLTVIEEKMDEPTEFVTSQPVEEGLEMDRSVKRVASEETAFSEEEAAMHENVEKQAKRYDMEAKAEGANVFLQPTKEHAGVSKEEVANANLMTREPRAEDEGNGIALDVLNKKEKVDCPNSVGRGLDSTLQLGIEATETSKSASTTSVKQENDAINIGKLDLSLSLSGCLQNSELKCSVPKTGSLAHATCSQPFPSSSFRTNSDGFTASISLTNSQTLGHNASCSLTQQSLDNHDHSVGSKPLFMGVDQMSNCAGWQAQLSSESIQKGGATPLRQRVLQNGQIPDNTLVGINGHNNATSSDLRRHASIPGVLSPTHSRDSHDSGLEHSRLRRKLTREGSSSSLTRGERKEGEQLVINGASVIERIISKVVSEPLHHTGRMLQEMTDNSITYLREAISEIVVDPDKRGQIIALQESLKKRSDLNRDMLRMCPRVLMEILVAIRTGLPYFVKKSSSVTTPDLVDIFLNLKCRNLSCQSVLPVDDCDCKICQRKAGFCSSCMCIVCSKFDSASNTCSWVGCDVCLHWCHTDCGLRHSLIQKGQSASRAHNTTEMQFHCAACGHPSEMFGFVKEVFRTCVKQWRMETLIRELGYVERIFSASDDTRGKRVKDFVKKMLIMLENNAYHPEVAKCVIAFFSDDDANLGIGPSVPLKGIPCSIAEGIDGIPNSSRKAAWIPFTLEGLPVLEKATTLSTTGSPSMHRKSGEAEFQAIDNKPVIDELDSLVRLKQAEANMYQERANDARNEADNLERIVMVKSARIEEDYAAQIDRLNINELQERRKQNIEELQVMERTHHQFLSMKTRMKACIRELLLKMEALKQN